MRWRISVFLPCLLLAAGAAVAWGQSIWSLPERGNGISLDMCRLGSEPGGREYTPDTVSLFFDLKIPVEERTWLVGELPFAHVEVEEDPYIAQVYAGYLVNPAQNVVGNPYLGIRRTFNDGEEALEIGATLPLTPDDKLTASGYGLRSDLDRYGAFAPDLMSLKIMLEFSGRNRGGFWRLRFGPDGLFDTKNRSDNQDFEMLFHAGGVFGYQGSWWRSWAGLNTVTMTTEKSFVKINDRTEVEGGFGFELVRYPVQPGVFLRVNEDRVVYGLHLAWILP